MIEAITKKKAMLDALETILGYVEEKIKDCGQDYRKTDKMEQKTEWDAEERKWKNVFDDDGNPVMVNVWDYVELPDDEMSDEKKALRNSYKEIQKTLEKMI